MKNNNLNQKIVFNTCEKQTNVNNYEQLQKLSTSYKQIFTKLFQYVISSFHILTIPTTSITILWNIVKGEKNEIQN